MTKANKILASIFEEKIGIGSIMSFPQPKGKKDPNKVYYVQIESLWLNDKGEASVSFKEQDFQRNDIGKSKELIGKEFIKMIKQRKSS